MLCDLSFLKNFALAVNYLDMSSIISKVQLPEDTTLCGTNVTPTSEFSRDAVLVLMMINGIEKFI
jgi:hypothetical protein